MHAQMLAAMLEEEKSAPQYFQPLPFYYIEIAKLLFLNSVDSFGEDFLEVSEDSNSLVISSGPDWAGRGEGGLGRGPPRSS